MGLDCTPRDCCPTCMSPLDPNAFGMTIDLDNQAVIVDGWSCQLPWAEAAVMYALVKAYPGYATRDRIMNAIHGIDAYNMDAQSVESHVCKLRKKLGRLGAGIENQREVGYRLTRIPVQHLEKSYEPEPAHAG